MKKLIYLLPLLMACTGPKTETEPVGLLSDTLNLDSPKVETPVVDSNKVDSLKK